MAYEILGICAAELPLDDIAKRLEQEGVGSFHVRQVRTLDEADYDFYESRVALVIAHSDVEGAKEKLADMKNDEMFGSIPVIVIVPDGEQEQMRTALALGMDNVIHERAVESLLYPLIKPLIKTYLSNEEMQARISDLQERAIQDFILLDLIKDYIPKTIWDVARTYAHLQKIAIPEEETELTIVFADIKGFTAMTQHLQPREVVRILNMVFDVVTRLVYEYGGDIDKFIGDAFFAVFADPRAAVESMVKLQTEIESINAAGASEGRPAIRFRIGVHTGSVIRGNVGGNHRYDNTLIGDSVNTASRLESIAPAGGILVSEETLSKAGLLVPAAYMRREHLRGRDREDTFYEVFDYFREHPIEPRAAN